MNPFTCCKSYTQCVLSRVVSPNFVDSYVGLLISESSGVRKNALLLDKNYSAIQLDIRRTSYRKFVIDTARLH